MIGRRAVLQGVAAVAATAALPPTPACGAERWMNCPGSAAAAPLTREHVISVVRVHDEITMLLEELHSFDDGATWYRGRYKWVKDLDPLVPCGIPYGKS